MSWGVALRNAIGLGLGGIPSLRNAPSFRATLAFNFLSGLLDPRITFSRTSTATRVNSTGLIESVAIDTPRFDYNPVTLAAKGLLIEEQRTNICLYSNDLNQATWGKGATVSVTYDTTAAPDGTTTADTITVVSGADTGVYQNITCASSTTYTWSVYVKLGTMVASDYKISIYDDTNAAFIAVDIVPTQTPSATAWTRVTYTFTTPATCVSVRPYCFRNSLSAATSVNVWGMQLEQGEFATSYIPTTTIALTRAADVATMTGVNFSSWFNQTKGTFSVEYQGVDNVSGATRRAFEIGNTGSISDRYVIGYSATNQTRTLVVAGGVTQADIYVNATQFKVVKAASAYAANNINSAANGTIGTLDTSATIPTVSTLWLGTAEGSAGNTVLNGHIRSFSYYNTRLSDAQLQSLSYVPWTPEQLTTASWWDANDASTITLNGSTVSQWKDKSDNGRHMVQATAALQPNYGVASFTKPSVNFGDDFMASTAIAGVASDWAIYGVNKQTEASPPANDSILSSNATGAGMFQVSSGTTTLVLSANADGTGTFFGYPIDPSIAQNYRLFGLEAATTGTTSYLNGTQAGTNAVTIRSTAIAGFKLNVNRAGGLYLQSDHAEWIVLPSVPATDVRQKIEGYLAWKWGGV